MQSGKATNKVSMGERGDGWSKIANVSVLIIFKYFCKFAKHYFIFGPQQLCTYILKLCNLSSKLLLSNFLRHDKAVFMHDWQISKAAC